MPTHKQKTNDWLLPALILACGIALRLLFLGKNDLWYDEAYSLFFPISVIQNAPLYYLFLHIWIQPLLFFQISSRWFEFFCRIPSALFSISCLPVLYLLAKKTLNKNSALYAMLFLALSPFQIWYAQESRPYALATLLALLSILFFTNHLQENENYKKNISLYVLFATLGLYTHYFFIFLPVLCLIHAMDLKKPIRQLLPLGLPFLFWLPWFPLITQQMAIIGKGFWPARPNFESLRITFENCLLGYNGTLILYIISDFLLVLLAIVFLYHIFRKNDKRSILIFYSALFLFPISCTFLLSNFSISIYIDRNFNIFVPYFFLLIGALISSFKNKILKFGLLSTLAILLILSDMRYFTGRMYAPQDMRRHMGVHPKKPIRPIAEYLLKNFDKFSKDKIIVTSQSVTFPIQVYYYLSEKTGSYKLRFDLSNPGSLIYFAFDPAIKDPVHQRPYTDIYQKNIMTRWLARILIPKNLIFNNIIEITPGKIFFIGCDWSRSGKLDENSKSIKSFLDSRLDLLEELNFDGIMLSVYKT